MLFTAKFFTPNPPIPSLYVYMCVYAFL